MTGFYGASEKCLSLYSILLNLHFKPLILSFHLWVFRIMSSFLSILWMRPMRNEVFFFFLLFLKLIFKSQSPPSLSLVHFPVAFSCWWKHVKCHRDGGEGGAAAQQGRRGTGPCRGRGTATRLFYGSPVLRHTAMCRGWDCHRQGGLNTQVTLPV